MQNKCLNHKQSLQRETVPVVIEHTLSNDLASGDVILNQFAKRWIVGKGDGKMTTLFTDKSVEN